MANKPLTEEQIREKARMSKRAAHPAAVALDLLVRVDKVDRQVASQIVMEVYES